MSFLIASPEKLPPRQSERIHSDDRNHGMVQGAPATLGDRQPTSLRCILGITRYTVPARGCVAYPTRVQIHGRNTYTTALTLHHPYSHDVLLLFYPKTKVLVHFVNGPHDLIPNNHPILTPTTTPSSSAKPTIAPFFI